MLVGLVLPIAVFGLVDAMTWSYPFQSYIRYVRIVVMEGKGTQYGVSPWHFYPGKLLFHFGPVLLVALVGLRRSPFLGWIAFIVVASHSLLAHKELRFIYPVMPIVLALAALGFVEIANAFNQYRFAPLSSKTVAILGLGVLALTSGLLAWEYPRWSHHAGGLVALDRLSDDSSVCGVGIYKLGVDDTGGYTHLHRNVPIVLVQNGAEFDEQMSSFNAIVTAGTLREPLTGFQVTECWKDACLYRRPGPCIASAKTNEVNEFLREHGG
jgi:hypothetical protein